MENKKSFYENIIVVVLGAILCNFLWGSATPAIKTGYKLFNIASSDTASVVLFAGVRFFIAGFMVVIAGSFIQKSVLIPKSFNSVKKVIILGLFQTVLQYFFFYGGLTRTPGVKSSIILATNVFASLLIASLVFKQEKLTVSKIIGCIIGFFGVVLVNVFGNELDYKITFGGEGFIFLSSVCYGISGSLVKRFSKDENTVMLSGCQFIFGGTIMIIAGLILGGKFSGFTLKTISLLAYLCFISAFAYTLWGLLLSHNDVSRVVIFGFSNPIFGVVLSSIFLNEKSQTGLITIISLILVCIGIFIVNKPKKTSL